MQTRNLIDQLRNLMKENDIEAYYIPNNDEFQNEYLPDSAKRLEFLTGFTGSAGEAIITLDKAAFFTDGRYTIQAAQEVDSDIFEIFNIKEKKLIEWAEEESLAVSYDPWLVTIAQSEKLTGKPVEKNLVDLLWNDRPTPPNNPSMELPIEFAGKTSEEKIAKIVEDLEEEAVLITNPISVNWLFNIRGSDLAYTPIKFAYAIIYKNGDAELLEFPNHLKINSIDTKTVQLDPKNCPEAIKNALKCGIIGKPDPCILSKSIKNPTEIEGIINAHLDDGLALTNFINWLKNNQDQDELSAAKKLEEFRKEDPNYKAPSFTTISGFGSNGAIVHYSATAESNKKFTPNNLYLVDSGGQYFGKDFDISCGTTDVTRTIAIGTPTAEMVHDYTLVLKGHIAVAMAEFESHESNSATLDTLARQFLRAEGKDFDHGTGHGVGHYLSVHEGPCGISPRYKISLQPGMVISNEPGYYKEGEYGIRIENLVLVIEKPNGKLGFHTLTLAPLDEDLIEWDILTNDEKDWIANYNERIAENTEDNDLLSF